jgi:2-furoyl-CoA dehydrogenase large subunit
MVSTLLAESANALADKTVRHVGKALERLEDAALLRGQGTYADDLGTKPGTVHAAILRSPHAHALIVGIDVSQALKVPGVRSVLTSGDVKAWAQPFVVGVKAPMQHWCLAMDRVRYVGEPVAVVMADSRAQAEDALDAIEVHYEVLPAVVGIEAALKSDAALLHPDVGSNVVSDRHFRYGEPEQAFATASQVVSLEIDYPRNSCSPMECGVVMAEHLPMADGSPSYEVLSNFMGPFSLHAVMALALQVPGNRLRHRVPRDSGGSFGVKQSVFPYAVLMCLASRKVGSPVKWVEDRLEHLVAATSATARRSTIEAAVDETGRITALRYNQLDEVGAYLRAPEPATFYRMHGALTGAYDIAHLEVRNRVVVCNKTPTGLVRGFGGPQVYFALERLMDRVAVQTHQNPVALRLRHYVQREQFPYTAAAGAVLDSGDYQRLTEMALQAAEAQGLKQRQAQARARGLLYGIGVAAIVEPSISNMGYISTVLTAEQRAKAGPKNGAITSATVAIDLLGGVNVTIASAPAGQGHMTVCAQVVADVFGLQPEQIVTNVEFDTAKDAWSVAAGNYSSRFAGAVAGTVHLAASRLREKLAQLAAAQFNCPVDQVRFENGAVFDTVGGRSIPFTRLAANPHWAPALLPSDMAPGLRETAFWTAPTLAAPDPQDRVNTSAAYGFVFDICGLEIDPDTGRARVDRYITAHDAGTLLNPALVDGQIRGAFAQGLGAALMEEFRYAGDGGFLSGTLAEYLMPTACEVPDPIIVHLQTPSTYTPLGAKGVGEGNNMSTPVCVANAMADALRPSRDVADIRLPLTPSRILELMTLSEPSARHGSSVKSDVEAIPANGQTLAAHGHVDIQASPEAVFAVLTDPVALAQVMPGCHSLERVGPENDVVLRLRAEVTVGVSLVKARYRAEIEISERRPGVEMRLKARGSSSLGVGQGDGLVRLEPLQGNSGPLTRLHYDYTARVGGKVAAVGPRMLEGAAQLILRQLFEAIGRQVAHPPRGPDTSAATWWARLWARLMGQEGKNRP